MPNVLNVYDAKSHFSNLLAEVEDSGTVFTIMRYGHPVAQVVPVARPRRKIEPIKELVGKVKVNCDWFHEDISDWENA